MENKLEKAFSSWVCANSKLGDVSLAYLKSVLKDEPENRIYLDTEFEDEYLCIPYDGGNHPEYASTLDSQVNSVFLKDGNVFVEIDDCEEYESNRMDAIDVYYVANAVRNHKVNLEHL